MKDYIPHIAIAFLTMVILFLLTRPKPIKDNTDLLQDNATHIEDNNAKIDSLNKVIELNNLYLDSIAEVYAKKKVQIIYKDKINEKKYATYDTANVNYVKRYITNNF